MSNNEWGHRLDSRGNVAVDFVWGNIPMQPNDERGMAQLDPEQGNHIIATTEYVGFPGSNAVYPYLDTLRNFEVPDVVGLEAEACQNIITGSYLEYAATTSTVGATSQNNGKAKSMSPAAGTIINAGDTVNVVFYNYVNPGNPIAGMSTTFVPGNWTLSGGEVVMYLAGRTTKPQQDDVVRITDTDQANFNQAYNVVAVQNDDAFNTGGTAVYLGATEKSFQGVTSATGGFWVTL